MKFAVSFIAAFANAMVTETRRRGCDGIICGHIQKPELKTGDGIIYGNDGDWVESLSANEKIGCGSILVCVIGDNSNFLNTTSIQ